MQLPSFSLFLCITGCLIGALSAQTSSTSSTDLAASSTRNKACTQDYECTAYGTGTCAYGYCHYYTQNTGDRCGGNQYSGQNWDYCKSGLTCVDVNMYFIGTCAKVCSYASDCASTEYCVKPGGTASNYCTAAACDPTTGLCSDGRVCNNGACYTCSSSYACPSGYSCNSSGYCVSSTTPGTGLCYTNGDCPGSNQVCSKGTCMAACDLRVCPTRNHYCQNDQCMTGCLTIQNCDSNYELCDTSTNTCTLKNAVTPPSTNGCTTKDQCTDYPDSVCLNGACHYYSQGEGDSCYNEGSTYGNYCQRNVNLICTNYQSSWGQGTCIKVCTADTDCTPTDSTYCSKSSPSASYGVCKTGCRSAATCGTGQVCNNGSCSSCSSTTQCPAGQYCNGSGQCVTGCDYIHTCTDPQVCYTNTCVSQCDPRFCKPGTGRICNASTNNLCVVGCATNTDCPSGQKCDDTTKRCVDNCFGVKCNPGNHCNASTGACDPGCVADTDCGQGEFCNAGTCQDRCDDGTACSAGSYCLGKQCVAGCRNTYDCDKNQYCVNGQCQNTCNAQNDPCRDGTYCNNLFCTAGCNTDINCPSGKACSPDKRCVTPCSQPANCPLGNYCSGTVCRSGCQSDDNCPSSQQCTNGKCVDRCNSDNCYDGRYCSNGKCVNGCTQDSDCASKDYCNLRTYQCAERCSTIYNCRPQGYGQYCDANNNCVSGCTSNSHCSTNDYCDLTTHKCKAKCTYLICYGANYCKDDYTCVSKVGGASTPAAQVVAQGKTKCTQDKDCKPGTEYCDLAYGVCMTRCTDTSCARNYHCDNYRSCVPNVVDLGCSYDRDCGSGYYCNAKTRKCVVNCSTTNCSGTCKDYKTCVAAATAECTWDQECPSGAYCTKDGKCKSIAGRLCYTNQANYCGYNYVCVGLAQYKRYNIGQCYPQAKSGGKCGYGTYPVQCPSGYSCKATTASKQYGICQVTVSSKSKVTAQSKSTSKSTTKTTTKSTSTKLTTTTLRPQLPVTKPKTTPVAPKQQQNSDWGAGDDVF